MLKDNSKIIIIWLVKAIPKGVKLKKLQEKIKKNKEKIKGKNLIPDKPICCFNKPNKK